MSSLVTALRDVDANTPRDAVRAVATCSATAKTDMLVRRAADVSFLGDNITNQDGTNQSKILETSPGQPAVFYTRLSNDGNTPNRFRIRTEAPEGDWSVSCSGPQPTIAFDGINDAIRVDDAPALRPASLTAEGWFLATASNDSRTLIAKGYGTQDWDSYVIWIDYGTLHAGVMNATGGIDSLSFNWNSLPAGWHHVAMTFDANSDELSLIVDGVLRGQRNSQIEIAYDAHPLTIGCDTRGVEFPHPFAGHVREVRLWNHARSLEAIQDSLHAKLTGSEPGIIALWPLTDGAGLTATDLTGNFHGNLINGTAWIFHQPTDLTPHVTSPGGWDEIVLSAGQSYDLTVTLTPSEVAMPGNRCDLLVHGENLSESPVSSDTVRLSAVIPETPSSQNQSKTFTTNEDFDRGTLVGVEFSNSPNQLQLSESSITLPFIWVPNSNQGTISKVDSRSGAEIARYRVCPDSVYGNPSRTTVDQRGSCWVGNRRTGTAVKVGLFENGGYIDRNHDGIIQTSTDANQNGSIDSDEILPWGEDECVLIEVVVIPGKEGAFTPGSYTNGYANDDWNPGPRGIAIDADGNLWLGSYGTRTYHKIDGNSGAILKSIDLSSVNHTPYGAVIDRNGILWSSSADKWHVLRLDPLTESFQTINLGHYSYGLALDQQGHLFVSGWENSKLSRINTATAVKEWTLNGVYQSRGVAVTADGDVWTANSGPGTVTRFSNSGAVKATIEVGNTPTGVATDADGKVWVVNFGDSFIKRIDPATNTVSLSKDILSGANHYGYSDMTGIVARNTTTRFGTWSLIHDSTQLNSRWQSVGWYALTPEQRGLTVRLRTSNDGVNWSTWLVANNGEPLPTLPAGRFLQVEALFQLVTTSQGEVSPILYDLTITPTGAPALHISLGTDQQIKLTGVGYAEDWILERSDSLNQGSWTEVPFTAETTPDGFTISLTRESNRAFFRLRHK